MQRLKNILFHPSFLPFLIVLVFAILAGRTLIFQQGYFNMHDDLQMMRQLEMEKCFLDGQIPCRWIADMGYGFGFPLFNFYPPLPYLIGQGIRLFGFSFIDTVKLNFALSFVVSGVGMYLLAKEFFGKLGGVLSGIFYIWAPYHAVDVYVRGAMNEAWALSFSPFIFWAGYRLLTDSKKKSLGWIILLALTYFALLTSHNLMVLIFTPVFALWLLIHLWQRNAWSRLPRLIVSGLWALGLASFFTLPALAENKFTHIRGQLEGYYDYTAHFVSLRQLLITRFWDYGPSVWIEAEDRMSFQIGHVHWILSLIIAFFLAVVLIRGRRNLVKRLKKDNFLLVTLFLLLVGWFSAFMTHLRSIFIYKAIPILGYIQFPWRFLTLVIFAFSFVVGVIPGSLAKFKQKHGFFVKLFATPPQVFATFLLIFILVALGWRYFLPEHGRMGPLTDEEKFSGAAWDLQQTAGIYDYLPATAEMAPREAQKQIAEFIEGEGEIADEIQGTDWAQFKANIDSDSAIIRLGIFQFPGWKTYVDAKEIENFVPEEEKWGRMYIRIPKGQHLVRAEFVNTRVRSLGNVISLVSWAILAGVVIRRRRWLKN